MELVKVLTLGFMLCMGLREVKPQVNPLFLRTDREYDHYLDLNPIAAEFTKHYGNITDVEFALSKLRLPTPQDLKCLADMAQLLKGLSARNLWALRSK